MLPCYSSQSVKGRSCLSGTVWPLWALLAENNMLSTCSMRTYIVKANPPTTANPRIPRNTAFSAKTRPMILLRNFFGAHHKLTNVSIIFVAPSKLLSGCPVHKEMMDDALSSVKLPSWMMSLEQWWCQARLPYNQLQIQSLWMSSHPHQSLMRQAKTT